MPWKPDDATRHTKAANTDKLRRQWADVANGELDQHGDERAAIRAANGVIKRHHQQKEMGPEPKGKHR